MVAGISRIEFNYILLAGGFAIVWFILIIPYLLGKGIESISPALQFLLFNVGLYVVLFFIFKSWTLGTSVSLTNAFLIMITIVAIDIWLPGYHVNMTTGELMTGELLGQSTADYVIGSLWHSLEIRGITVTFLTYGLTPFILLLIAAMYRKNFVRSLS